MMDVKTLLPDGITKENIDFAVAMTRKRYCTKMGCGASQSCDTSCFAYVVTTILQRVADYMDQERLVSVKEILGDISCEDVVKAKDILTSKRCGKTVCGASQVCNGDCFSFTVSAVIDNLISLLTKEGV